jgi:FMN phosphatase YigB (HAD superfamily)
VITSLLIDLDDTLLTNNVDRFVPAYVELLSQHLDPVVAPEKMIYQLNLGTQAMMANSNLNKTLAEVFDEKFFTGLGLSREVLMPQIDSFYADHFGKLRYLTEPIPASQRFMNYAFDNQYDIVIATNPLFPRTAIEQRLEWAGIPVTQYPYTLITSYENFHFAKPKLEYITEILAKCGRHPHESAMIGNDLILDLPPAAELGSAVFHISENTDGPYPSGDLDAAIQWLQVSPPDSDPTRCTSPQALLARLRGNLIAFTELENLLPGDLWQRKPSPDEWAPIEILCHLRDVEEEINYHRVNRILKEHEPFISAQDSDQWARERRYIDESPSRAHLALLRARRRTLSLLEFQPPGSWNRPVRHAIFGPTQLSEIVRIFLEHDILHLRQFKETLATITAKE